MRPKVLIQIMLRDDDTVSVSSTSNNHITNLGMMGVAQSMFLNGVKEQEPSGIVIPRL